MLGPLPRRSGVCRPTEGLSTAPAVLISSGHPSSGGILLPAPLQGAWPRNCPLSVAGLLFLVCQTCCRSLLFLHPDACFSAGFGTCRR